MKKWTNLLFISFTFLLVSCVMNAKPESGENKTAAKGEVIVLDKASFLTKVYNYEKNHKKLTERISLCVKNEGCDAEQQSKKREIIAAVEKIKSRNDHKYGTKPQRSLALGEIAAQFFNFFHTTSKKISIRMHIFSDLTMYKRMRIAFLPGGSDIHI